MGGWNVCLHTHGRLAAWARGVFLELAKLQKHLSKGMIGVVPIVLNKSTLLTKEACRNLPHVTVCLLGKFKGKTGIDHHLITLANETVLGLQPCWWIEKFVLVCEQEGRVNKPAFATPDESWLCWLIMTQYSEGTCYMVQEEMSLILEDQEVESRYLTNRILCKTA